MVYFKQKNGEKYNNNWKRIFLFTVIFLLNYFILITAIAPAKYNFKEGDIADIDIKAPRDAINQDETNKKEQEAIKMVPLQYSLQNDVKLQAVENVRGFFKKIINIKQEDTNEQEKVSQLKKIEGFNFTEGELKKILALTDRQIIELEWNVVEVLEKVYNNNIKENNQEDIKMAITIDDAKKICAEILDDIELESSIKEILLGMSNSQIKANYFYDDEKTDELIKEALKNTPKEMIKKNQLIVREGEPITKGQIAILSDFGMVGSNENYNYLPLYVCLAGFTFLILMLQLLYLKKEHNHIMQDTKKLIMLQLLNLTSLLLARGLNFISPFLIPLGCTTILMTLLLDYKISIVMNMLNMLLIAVIVGFNPNIFIIAVVSIIIGATTIKGVNGRTEILYSTVLSTVGVTITALTSGILISNNIRLIMNDVVFTAIGALLSGILAIGLLPFLEATFGIVSNIRLLELANPNNLLLKRILMEAPGTYHHSLMVANLAEIAAEEVEANPIIARVGAYYHDVGKIKRPMFFGENQMGRENPHDSVDEKLSSKIILSHTKDGLELAKEFKVPKIIQDIIIQHHGTTLVKYFYHTARNNAENPDNIEEEDFKYSGPIPDTKEAAIVMLADSVEAAVRSINKPTKEKIEDMVNNIINDKLSSKQLDNSDLTLRDIEKIKRGFLKTLDGVYHQRIEYPKGNK